MTLFAIFHRKKIITESYGAGSLIHFVSFPETEGEEHRSNLTRECGRETLAIWMLLAPW